MIAELIRYLKNPLYRTVLATGLMVRGIMAYLDSLYRESEFWSRSANFWSTFGSVTTSFLILLALIRHFSLDTETNTAPTVISTKNGRLRLFGYRLIAGCVAVFIGIALLSVGNLVLSVGFGRHLPGFVDPIASFMLPPVISAVGAVGFFVTAACVCDIFKNQPIAMAACGIPFGIGYFVNADAVKTPGLFLFFRYGFFTELTRGRMITYSPMFWSVWYSVLIGGILLAAIRCRKERKEL